MNEDERGNELPDPEAVTAAPDRSDAVPPPAGGWQMPQPKFQQTSGYLPQGYIDQIGVAAAAASGAAAAPAMSPPAPGAAEVEAQPDLTDQLAPPPAPAIAAPAVKERSTAARAAMIVLGLLAMVAFLVLFLGVVYYLFLAPPGAGTQF
jgi:hypothetical protein